MKLVDTNVFIYAVGGTHEYKGACARLSAELIRGEHDANIDTELLQEILYRFWRRGRHQEGLQLFDILITGFPDSLPITTREMTLARDLLSRHPQIGPRDAIHAAVVLTYDLEGIVSTDRGFDSIPGLTRFDPMDL